MDPAGTRSHTMMPGTHAYMAPEAELGPTCDYTEKVDIFSFGVLIIHTLTHQLPVPGPTRAKVNGRMIAVGEYERRKHHLRACSDAEVEAFQKPIQRCLEFDPDDRITSTSLVQDLQVIQEVVGEPTMGNVLQDAPQCTDGGDELKEVQEKLLAAELKARKTEELRKEEVATLERTIQILQQKNEEVIQVKMVCACYTVRPISKCTTSLHAATQSGSKLAWKVVWLNTPSIRIKTSSEGGLAQYTFNPDRNQCAFSINAPIWIKSGLKAQCKQMKFLNPERTKM